MSQKEAARTDFLQMTHTEARAGRKASAAQVLVEQDYDAIKALRHKEPRAVAWRNIAEKLSANGHTISHTALKNIYEKLEAEGGP
jgi:hypothetical protein